MYSTNNHRITEPFATAYNDYTDGLKGIKLEVESIENAYRNEITKLDIELEKAKKQPNFHKESYLQHDYTDWEAKERRAKRLYSLFSKLYNLFEFDLLKILETDTRQIRKSSKHEAKLSVYFEHIEDVLNINISSYIKFKNDMFVLKDMRVDEQHYGGQESIKKGSEEMKLLIEDYANRILEFLDNLNKKMFNIKYPPK